VKRLLAQSLIGVVFTFLCNGLVLANGTEYGLDTTRVRQPERPKKSFGRVVADIPGEILKLPVRTVRLLALSTTKRPISHVTQLINIAGPAKRYVPVVGYSSTAGLKLGFGLRKIKKRFWDDRLDFRWYYSTNDYQSYQFRFRLRESFVDWMGLDLFHRYMKRPRESFYGVGMGVPEENEANYTLESSEFRLDVPFHADGRLSAGMTGGYILTNLYDGRDTDHPRNLDSLAADPRYSLLPGRLDGARYIRFGLIVEFDGRDNGGQPSNGFHILTRWVRYFGTGRSQDLNYYETNVDVRHYLNVWRKRILATRVYVQRFDADNNNERATPINLVSRLGGASGLRAYSPGRFTDNDLLLASVEWRFPVWRTLDGFVFLDGGRVYEEITDAQVFRHWRYSSGMGLRVWNLQEVSFSTTFAFGEEGSRFYVASGITW
jgi:outer membrane protein assembly factor BamA